MFTLNDLKNPTINIAQIYSDKIKVYDEITEVFPFDLIEIYINQDTNKLFLKIKSEGEMPRTILVSSVSPELAASFKLYSDFIKRSLNNSSLTEDEMGLYNVFGLSLEIDKASFENKISSIVFHIEHYDDYVNIDELLQIILKRISSFK